MRGIEGSGEKGDWRVRGDELLGFFLLRGGRILWV